MPLTNETALALNYPERLIVLLPTVAVGKCQIIERAMSFLPLHWLDRSQMGIGLGNTEVRTMWKGLIDAKPYFHWAILKPIFYYTNPFLACCFHD